MPVSPFLAYKGLFVNCVIGSSVQPYRVGSVGVIITVLLVRQLRFREVK